MNPYEPPRAEITRKRMISSAGRSPAERAFDWTFLPFVPIFVPIVSVLTYAKHSYPIAGAVVAVVAAIYWFFCAAKVFGAWRDPAGKVLRFASLALLLFQAIAIAMSVLL